MQKTRAGFRIKLLRWENSGRFLACRLPCARDSSAIARARGGRGRRRRGGPGWRCPGWRRHKDIVLILRGRESSQGASILRRCGTSAAGRNGCRWSLACLRGGSTRKCRTSRSSLTCGKACRLPSHRGLCRRGGLGRAGRSAAAARGLRLHLGDGRQIAHERRIFAPRPLRVHLLGLHQRVIIEACPTIARPHLINGGSGCQGFTTQNKARHKAQAVYFPLAAHMKLLAGILPFPAYRQKHP